MRSLYNAKVKKKQQIPELTEDDVTVV